MDRDVFKEFEQILFRSMGKNMLSADYATSGFFEELEAIGANLLTNPGNPDFVHAYRKQIITIKGLLITALIEALDNLDRKVENLDGINALLENIAHVRRIQNRKDLVTATHLIIDNFNQYNIGTDKK